MRPTVSLTVAVAALLLAACSADTKPTTTTDIAPLATLELAADGLGDVLFGLDPESVVADISARYGAPDHDSGWTPSIPNIYGTCPGERMRAIGWGSLVTIFIDDGDSDLGGFFYTYTYGFDYSTNTGGADPRGLALETTSGLGLGTTVSAAEAALGDQIVSGDETLDTWAFTAEESGFKGLLSGQGASDTITLIEPIEGCS